MEKLNTAIIGTGSHAQTHFRMVKDAEEMHLMAVCDVSQERLERVKSQHKPEYVFTDYREMIDKCDLDVVHVVTQPLYTREISIYCLDKGLHTSVENPPGLRSSDTREILEASKKSKGMAMVSFNRRYIPEVLAVRKMVMDRGGAIHCATTYNKATTVWPEDWGKYLLINDGIHHVDLLRWLGGDLVAVRSEFIDNIRSEQRHNAFVRFSSGNSGVMMSHFVVGYRIQRAEVHAENFSAYMDLTSFTSPPKCELYENGKPYDRPLNLDAIGGKDYNEVRHFIECIGENKEPWNNLEDAVKTMDLCEAILHLKPYSEELLVGEL